MIFSYLLNMQSHPSWVCGLKLTTSQGCVSECSSHPSWVCGLKHLKDHHRMLAPGVTPFVGVWIET